MPKLQVKVFEAKDLIIADTFSSDPYYYASWAESTFKSKVHKKNLNPKFNDTFVLTAKNLSDVSQPLVIRMFDKDTFTSDDPMGNISIALNTLKKQKPVKFWVDLKQVSKGKIYIELCALDFGAEPTQMSPMQPQQPYQGNPNYQNQYQHPQNQVQSQGSFYGNPAQNQPGYQNLQSQGSFHGGIKPNTPLQPQNSSPQNQSFHGRSTSGSPGLSGSPSESSQVSYPSMQQSSTSTSPHTTSTTSITSTTNEQQQQHPQQYGYPQQQQPYPYQQQPQQPPYIQQPQQQPQQQPPPYIQQPYPQQPYPQQPQQQPYPYSQQPVPHPSPYGQPQVQPRSNPQMTTQGGSSSQVSRGTGFDYIVDKPTTYVVRQKFFSLTGGFTIKKDDGTPVYKVEGGVLDNILRKDFKFYDMDKNMIGRIQSEMLSFMPCYVIYKIEGGGSKKIAKLKQKFTFFHKKFTIDLLSTPGKDYTVKGSPYAYDFVIRKNDDTVVATITKKVFFQLTDTYGVTVEKGNSPLLALMCAIAIDKIFHEGNNKNRRNRW